MSWKLENQKKEDYKALIDQEDCFRIVYNRWLEDSKKAEKTTDEEKAARTHVDDQYEVIDSSSKRENFEVMKSEIFTERWI